MTIQTPFLFTVCQAGAEKALKEELALTYPNLHFAYSRPGFVTFKSTEGQLTEEFRLNSVFARAYGLSLGRKIKEPSLQAMAAQVWEVGRAMAKDRGQTLRLHVFERDQHAPHEEPLGYERGRWAEAARQAIEAAAPADPKEAAETFYLPIQSLATGTDLVLDVICIEEGEWWLGMHRHAFPHSPAPGGQWPVVLPPEAPSRAYLKLEEALAWSGAPIREGDLALELGSAPGGASYALLERGVNVVGIDPAVMDPAVLNYRRSSARFLHVPSAVAHVPREDLPEYIHWLLADMNVEPRIALAQIDRLSHRTRDTLLGVILTLKLNQWSLAKEIPSWLEHVKVLGMNRVRATQLAHNRREICVVGYTKLGMARLRKA